MTLIGNVLEAQEEGLELTINSKQEKTPDENNSNLKTLHLNYEGMSPYFEKDVTEYYFIADKTIDALKIDATPEEDNASIKITGNDNFKTGINEVKIEVTSPNGKNSKTYTINVTKTNDINLANSNLETLAIENSLLYPSFDTNITEYNIEIENGVDSLNILAVPENQYSTVTIEGENDLKVGDNLVTITVNAQDGITTKKYYLTVHRRTKEEEILEEKEEKQELQKLNALIKNEDIQTFELLEPTEMETSKTHQHQEEVFEKENNSFSSIITPLIILTLIFVPIIIIIIKKFKKKNTNHK